MTPAPKGEERVWAEDRIEELKSLRELIWEIEGLDRGSNFIDHIQDAIKRAKALNNHDLSNGRVSFVQFLIEQANKDIKEKSPSPGE